MHLELEYPMQRRTQGVAIGPLLLASPAPAWDAFRRMQSRAKIFTQLKRKAGGGRLPFRPIPRAPTYDVAMNGGGIHE